MSLNSGLTRGKNGELLRDGKPIVLGLDTGDDTPVKVDERMDVDINRLVSNEMARQDLFRIPGSGDYPDLTEYPVTRGDAESRLRGVEVALRPHMQDGESFEQAQARFMVAAAKAQASLRDSNAVRAGSEPIATVEPKAPVVPIPTPSGEPLKPK